MLHTARNWMGDKSPIMILIMGPTGSGKSTFINLASGSNLKVSSSLASCTEDVEVAPEFTLYGRTITLVDTPGFDDTEKSQIDVLSKIAGFLMEKYRQGVLFHGVIYFHRITDIRVGSTSRQSFAMFTAICGSAIKNAVILTNMWDKISLEQGAMRERELISDPRFFKSAIDQGARLVRHDGLRTSAYKILELFLQRKPVTLGIQSELAAGRTIVDTEAGKEINRELHQLSQKFQEEINAMKAEIEDALRNNDLQAKAELDHDLRRAEADLEKVIDDIGKFQSQGQPKRRAPLDANSPTVAESSSSPQKKGRATKQDDIHANQPHWVLSRDKARQYEGKWRQLTPQERADVFVEVVAEEVRRGQLFFATPAWENDKSREHAWEDAFFKSILIWKIMKDKGESMPSGYHEETRNKPSEASRRHYLHAGNS